MMKLGWKPKGTEPAPTIDRAKALEEISGLCTDEELGLLLKVAKNPTVKKMALDRARKLFN